MSVDVGVRLAERVGELLGVLDVDAAGEKEREGLLERDALAEGEDETDLTEADVVGVTVMPGAMQQPGRTTLQLTSTKPAAVICTQLLLRPALLG